MPTDSSRFARLRGLFIARSIAEAHGGTLDVESVPERGSLFRLELPAS